MSHLLKKEKKIYYKIFLLIFFLCIIYLFFKTLISYEGNKFNYISFSFFSTLLILFAFRKHALFFETYFALFIWLGFWFKFSFTVTYLDAYFREGVQSSNFTILDYDNSIIVSQVSMISLMLSGLVREKCIFIYSKKIDLGHLENIFYIKYANLIWVFFLIFVISVSFINFYLKIYQKGLIPNQDFGFLTRGIITWLILFGLSSMSSLLIFWHAVSFKKYTFLIIIFMTIEVFLSYSSMISRGMIFNSLALLFGMYKFSKTLNFKNTFLFYLKSLAIILFLSYLSIVLVNYTRAVFYYKGESFTESSQKEFDKLNSENKFKDYKLIATHNTELLYLIINRWVGIDAVVNVVSKKELLGFDLFKKSLKEENILNENSFYEKNFDINVIDYQKQNVKNVKGNIVPGIVAFSFYMGSYYFLFTFIFFLSLFCSLIEVFTYKFSNKNLVFCSIVGMVIAFRLSHFGYLPTNSYLLFGSILLTVAILNLINNISKNFPNLIKIFNK